MAEGWGGAGERRVEIAIQASKSAPPALDPSLRPSSPCSLVLLPPALLRRAVCVYRATPHGPHPVLMSNRWRV